ncbi:MAG: TolC family protein [Archangium sp.]|nr:TolC family protein [Archangium sp.]
MRALLLTLFVSGSALAALPASLTLEEALALAREHRPSLQAARAQVEAADARARQALAPLLPSVSFNFGYSRSTANFVARPGAVPSSVDTASAASLASSDYWSSGLQVSATLWDFGQGWQRYQAALSTAQAQEAQERAQHRTSDYTVRTLFFAAASQRELVEIARAALENTSAHLAQIDGMVKVGTRPEIDLAQAKADQANARLTVLNAKNGYAVARARVTQALGVAAPPTWEVVDGAPVAVEGEGQEVAVLLPEALGARPEVAALRAQVEAQERTLRGTRAAYFPSLGLQLGGTLASRQLPTIVPNLSGQLSLSWALYEGGVTPAREREGEATLRQLAAQRDELTLQVSFEVQQALLDVSSAKETVEVAAEARAAAQEKLRLAEGRYRAGAGNALELSDAQVTATQAAGQEVQAKFTLAAARAALVAALGRR